MVLEICPGALFPLADWRRFGSLPVELAGESAAAEAIGAFVRSWVWLQAPVLIVMIAARVASWRLVMQSRMRRTSRVV